MAEALYGPTGFYRRQLAAGHFRTSAVASPLFAAAISRLAAEVDQALGRPDPFDLVDVGAGGGELLAAIAASGLPARWRLTAVEIDAGRPGPLRWRTEIPRCSGLLVANEWLDNVPCELVERVADGLRLVRTDGSLGPAPSPADVAWLDRWWPLARVGDRAEVGRSRDAAWAGAVARLSRGVAVAIDYAHTAASRPPEATLISYRSGRAIPPVADGSADLTAHVALDACAAAASTGVRVADSVLSTQRCALRALGVGGRPPPYAGDPGAYLAGLSAAGEAAELLDPAGLGGFGWLVQTVGVALPPVLAGVVADTAGD